MDKGKDTFRVDGRCISRRVGSWRARKVCVGGWVMDGKALGGLIGEGTGGEARERMYG